MDTPRLNSSIPARSRKAKMTRPALPTNKTVSAGLAEPAGTQPSETSPTQCIDGDDDYGSPYAYAYAFLVAYNEDGPYVDAFVDTTALIDKTADGVRTAERLTGAANGAVDAALSGMQTLFLRERYIHFFDDAGPYQTRTQFPIDAALLTRALQAMPIPRRKAFLKEARI